MANVLSPRDLVSRPDNMDETVLAAADARSTVCVCAHCFWKNKTLVNPKERIWYGTFMPSLL